MYVSNTKKETEMNKIKKQTKITVTKKKKGISKKSKAEKLQNYNKQILVMWLNSWILICLRPKCIFLICQNFLIGRCGSSAQKIYKFFKMPIAQQQIELCIIFWYKVENMYFHVNINNNSFWHCKSPKMSSKVKATSKIWAKCQTNIF